MFDIHQDPCDEHGQWDDGAVEDYCDGLMEAFSGSPEGSAAAERYLDIGWTHSFLHYGFNYLGSAPPDMSHGDVSEILFELFPRKTSTEPETAGEIIGEIRAFWEFLRRQYGLVNASDILEVLGDDAEQRLERELADPDNFGMAKSFVMMGSEAGFDMTTEEGLQQFMLTYNASVAQNLRGAGPSRVAEPPPRPSAQTTANPIGVRLSVDERKSRQKLLRKKLGTSKRRRGRR